MLIASLAFSIGTWLARPDVHRPDSTSMGPAARNGNLAYAPTFKMQVRPGRFAFAPSDVEIRLRVEPGGRDRRVDLEIDGPAYFGASRIPIRADPTAPTMQHPVWYKSIPAGRYVITAVLSEGGRAPLARLTWAIRILGRGELPEEDDGGDLGPGRGETRDRR